MFTKDDARYGHKVVATPGTVRGLALAHRRFGKLPWAELLAPAIVLARDGFTIDANLVHYRELTLVGANGSSPQHNKQALAMIASGEVPVADLISVHLPLEQLHEALRIVADGEAIKVTIEP